MFVLFVCFRLSCIFVFRHKLVSAFSITFRLFICLWIYFFCRYFDFLSFSHPSSLIKSIQLFNSLYKKKYSRRHFPVPLALQFRSRSETISLQFNNKSEEDTINDQQYCLLLFSFPQTTWFGANRVVPSLPRLLLVCLLALHVKKRFLAQIPSHTNHMFCIFVVVVVVVAY